MQYFLLLWEEKEKVTIENNKAYIQTNVVFPSKIY